MHLSGLIPGQGSLLLFFLPLSAMAYLLLRPGAVHALLLQHRRLLTAVAFVLAAVPLLLTAGGNLLTLRQQRPFEHDEVSLLCVAAAWLHGQPMYPAAGGPLEYGILYGPLTFLMYLPPMLAGAVQFGFFQAWVLLGLLGTFTLVFATVRGFAGNRAAWFALCYFAAYAALNALFTWSVRADTWILFFVALAFWAAVRLRPAMAEIVIAVAAAAAILLKATLLMPVLLPFLWLWGRDTRSLPRRALGPALTSVLALLPFALPRVSLTGYRHELALAAHHGFTRQQFQFNAMFLTLNLVLPLLVSLWAAWSWNAAATRGWLRRRWPLFAATVLCIALLGTTGAKIGAGAWHLLPMGVPVALLMAELWQLLQEQRDRVTSTRTLPRTLAPALALAVALLAQSVLSLAVAVHARLHDWTEFHGAQYGPVQQDLLRIVREHPHETLAMGVSSVATYNLTWMRHVLPIAGEPLFLDSNTQSERDAAAEPYAPAMLAALADCRVSLWLIPRGAAPFSMHSLYSTMALRPANTVTHPELFPEPFPQIFLAHYHPVPSTSPYFELWACNTAPLGTAAAPRAAGMKQ